MRWSHVQPGQSAHRYSHILSRVVRVNTPTLRVWGEKERDQNNKELWRNPLTTLDTSSREEVRP